MKKKYTVVGHEENEGQCITDHVEADSVEQAMKIFSKARSAKGSTVIISVFNGHLQDRMPKGFSVYCADILKGKEL